MAASLRPAVGLVDSRAIRAEARGQAHSRDAQPDRTSERHGRCNGMELRCCAALVLYDTLCETFLRRYPDVATIRSVVLPVNVSRARLAHIESVFWCLYSPACDHRHCSARSNNKSRKAHHNIRPHACTRCSPLIRTSLSPVRWTCARRGPQNSNPLDRTFAQGTPSSCERGRVA